MVSSSKLEVSAATGCYLDNALVGQNARLDDDDVPGYLECGKLHPKRVGLFCRVRTKGDEIFLRVPLEQPGSEAIREFLP